MSAKKVFQFFISEFKVVFYQHKPRSCSIQYMLCDFILLNDFRDISLSADPPSLLVTPEGSPVKTRFVFVLHLSANIVRIEFYLNFIFPFIICEKKGIYSCCLLLALLEWVTNHSV